jgi:hypothetical protein
MIPQPQPNPMTQAERQKVEDTMAFFRNLAANATDPVLREIAQALTRSFETLTARQE